MCLHLLNCYANANRVSNAINYMLYKLIVLLRREVIRRDETSSRPNLRRPTRLHHPSPPAEERVQ
jgi:hypothetical protein